MATVSTEVHDHTSFAFIAAAIVAAAIPFAVRGLVRAILVAVL